MAQNTYTPFTAISTWVTVIIWKMSSQPVIWMAVSATMLTRYAAAKTANPRRYLVRQIVYTNRLKGTGNRKKLKKSTKYSVLPSGMRNCRKPHWHSDHATMVKANRPRHKKLPISCFSRRFLVKKCRKMLRMPANTMTQLRMRIGRMSVSRSSTHALLVPQ